MVRYHYFHSLIYQIIWSPYLYLFFFPQIKVLLNFIRAMLYSTRQGYNSYYSPLNQMDPTSVSPFMFFSPKSHSLTPFLWAVTKVHPDYEEKTSVIFLDSRVVRALKYMWDREYNHFWKIHSAAAVFLLNGTILIKYSEIKVFRCCFFVYSSL